MAIRDSGRSGKDWSTRRVPNVREIEGRRLAAGGHVVRLDPDCFLVSPPKSGKRFEVRMDERDWTCECPEHLNRNVRCVHIHAAEALVGMERRAERAKRIVESGHVHRVDDYTYLVDSQTEENSQYEVRDYGAGWVCICPDHMESGHRCKHMLAVDISAGRRTREATETVVHEINPRACRDCGSERTVKDSRRKIRNGYRQRYKCKDCGKRFCDNLGFEYRRATPEHITKAMECYFIGGSLRKAAQALSMVDCKVSHSTIHRWVADFGTLMEEFADAIRPQVGEAWRADEVFLKIRNNRRLLYTMIDSETRFWLASQMGVKKGNDDVAPMLKHAADLAGKNPETFATDGALNYHTAWRKVYRAKEHDQKKHTRHARHIHQDGDYNNNQMESFNGATLRLRLKVTRGLKSEDTPIVKGLREYYNHIRPHQGEGMNGETPGERAGIRVEGDDKWKTMIQNAAKKRAVEAGRPESEEGTK